MLLNKGHSLTCTEAWHWLPRDDRNVSVSPLARRQKAKLRSVSSDPGFGAGLEGVAMQSSQVFFVSHASQMLLTSGVPKVEILVLGFVKNRIGPYVLSALLCVLCFPQLRGKKQRQRKRTF